MDYKRELVYSYGDYVQAYHEQRPKNNNLPRTKDCIYLQPSDTLQRGHEVMDLMTGELIRVTQVNKCVMTQMVIARVEELATRQGYSTLKFFNRKKKEVVLEDEDTKVDLSELNDHVIDGENLDLPLENPAPSELLSNEDEELDVDEDIDPKELAGLIHDSRQARIPDGNEIEDQRELENEGVNSESEHDDGARCDKVSINESMGEIIPDLESEANESLIEDPARVERSGPTRNVRPPERYNPQTGGSYGQLEICHNIMTDNQPEDRRLQYEQHEVAVMAQAIMKVQQNYSQLLNLRKGLAEFKEEGKEAYKKELRQMHDRVCWRSLTVKELTRREKKRAQEGLMLLTRKKSGDVKGRLAYNGKPTRMWIRDEEKASPTVLTESLFSTCAIDAYESRDIMCLDIPNAFIQAGIPKREKGDRIVMKIRGQLVEWLVELDPETYRDHVVIENGVKVLYVEILRAIYGMLEAALMWYKKFRTDLEGIGFVFNPYDPCIAQRTVRGKQHLIRFHVDDVLSSHEESEVNDEFATWAQKLYGTVKPVEV